MVPPIRMYIPIGFEPTGPFRAVRFKLRVSLSYSLKLYTCFHQLPAPDLLCPRKSASIAFMHLTQKPPNGGFCVKWCAILCSYRTNFYDDFKKIIRKVKTYHNKILMFSI